MTDIPVHWQDAMAKANIGDPRNGRPSMRALAERSGESAETIRRMVRGLGNPEHTTVAAVASALNLDIRTVANWVGHTRTVREPFVPDENADLLTVAERAAVNRLIRVMTAERRTPVPPATARANAKRASAKRVAR